MEVRSSAKPAPLIGGPPFLYVVMFGVTLRVEGRGVELGTATHEAEV